MKRLDVFPKMMEGAVVRTSTGGFFTLATGVVVTLLILAEFYRSFLALDAESHMRVDAPATASDVVDVSLHITFPWMDCAELEIHSEHTKGETGFAAEEAFEKRRPSLGELSIFRKALGSEFSYPVEVEEAAQGGRGRREAPKKRTVYGCSIEGTARVPKIAGDLHIWVPAPRVSPMANLGALSQLFPGLMTVDAVPHNISHAIHRLGFGPTFAPMQSALDGETNFVAEGLAQYQYNLQLVPTSVRNNGRISVRTNQYSVTEDEMVLDAQSATKARYHPGVYFYYEFSPIAVEYHRNSGGLLAFLTSLCGLIGGALAVLRFVDTFAYRIMGKKHD